MDFSVLANNTIKIKERGKDRQIPWSCQRTEKAVEYEVVCNTSCSKNDPQRPKKETGWIGDQRMN